MAVNDKDLNLLGILTSIDDSSEGRSARERLFEELTRQNLRGNATYGRAKSSIPYIKTRVRAGIAG